MTTTGLFPGQSRKDYDALPGINVSLLLRGRRSMAHLKQERDCPTPPSAAMDLGNAIHAACLEPAAFAAQYVTAASWTL